MNGSCAFHKFWSTFFKRLGHYLMAGTRPAPAFGGLGWKRLLFYVLWYNYYFMHLGAIFILYASTRLLFYARQRNFMPRQFSSLAGFYPDRGGVEVTGQTASLLAKAAPSLQHHSSIGSWSLSMTIFLELSPPLTNYNVWTLISF